MAERGIGKERERLQCISSFLIPSIISEYVYYGYYFFEMYHEYDVSCIEYGSYVRC